MINRTAASTAIRLFQANPVLVITGPRQSGKTTLARNTFPDKPYINLEHPATLQRALLDPVSLLARCQDGAVIDEFQRAPQLASYIQTIVDQRKSNGMFILTGSQQLDIGHAVSQSLAGRAAFLRLLPLSLVELPNRLGTDQLLWQGFYPRIYNDHTDPAQLVADYIEAYVERDVRQIQAIRDLTLFHRFLSLCAGRIGGLLDVRSLGNDAGISHATAAQWLSVLEALYIVFRLPPWFANIGKRLIKSPKLYFYDVGIVASLLGIEHSQQMATHPLRGQLFENMVVADVLKQRLHNGRRPNLFFFRDSQHHEIDLLIQYADRFLPIEIKSGATFTTDYLTGFSHLPTRFPLHPYGNILVYGGDAEQRIRNTHLINHWSLSSALEAVDRSGDRPPTH